MFIVTLLWTHAVCHQTQIFLVKMKAPCLLTLIVIQISSKFLYLIRLNIKLMGVVYKKIVAQIKWFFLVDIADCCSSDTNMAVSNAYVSCLTNMPCVAKCYPGYIFPSGSTKKSYSCQNGEWTPFLSSCKRKMLNWIVNGLFDRFCKYDNKLQ